MVAGGPLRVRWSSEAAHRPQSTPVFPRPPFPGDSLGTGIPVEMKASPAGHLSSGVSGGPWQEGGEEGWGPRYPSDLPLECGCLGWRDDTLAVTSRRASSCPLAPHDIPSCPESSRTHSSLCDLGVPAHPALHRPRPSSSGSQGSSSRPPSLWTEPPSPDPLLRGLSPPEDHGRPGAGFALPEWFPLGSEAGSRAGESGTGPSRPPAPLCCPHTGSLPGVCRDPGLSGLQALWLACHPGQRARHLREGGHRRFWKTRNVCPCHSGTKQPLKNRRLTEAYGPFLGIAGSWGQAIPSTPRPCLCPGTAGRRPALHSPLGLEAGAASVRSRHRGAGAV